jgi:hypothetical protein
MSLRRRLTKGELAFADPVKQFDAGDGMSDDVSNQAGSSEPDPDLVAREQFEKGLLERGEAAPADENGNLPPGVTHEIVGYDSEQRPILQRRRFSIS